MIGLHNILTSKKGCKHVSSQVLWVCFSQSTQQAWEWVKPPLLEKFTKSLRATHGLYQKDYHRAQKMHNSKCTGCPSLGCSPGEAEIAPLCPRPAEVTMEPSAPHSSQPENLTNTWWELGAALTWDWQPPAGTSLGAAALCPLEKAQQFVVRGLCLQEHHPQAISEIKQICLGFLSRKFSFFCLLGFVQTTHRG